MVLPEPQAVPTFSPTTRYVFIEGHDLALQRQFVLVDDRCIDIGTWCDGESCLGYLIGHVVAGHDAEIVALDNITLRGKTDGESLLQTDIVRGLVLGEFEGDVFRSALASPSSHHHVGILVFVPCSNHDGGQWCDNSLVAEVLATLNCLYLDFLSFISCIFRS